MIRGAHHKGEDAYGMEACGVARKYFSATSCAVGSMCVPLPVGSGASGFAVGVGLNGPTSPGFGGDWKEALLVPQSAKLQK